MAIVLVPYVDLTKVYAQDGVLDNISGGAGPSGVTYNEGNGNVYVTNGNTRTVSVIESIPIANAGPDQTGEAG